jgi:hypothetical protein
MVKLLRTEAVVGVPNAGTVVSMFEVIGHLYK